MFKDLILEYYQKVDDKDVEWVIDLFADDASYQRADCIFPNKQSIADFYRNDRKIQGKHTVQGIIAEGDCVAAYGEFNGVGAEGQPKHVEFCDVWLFKGSKVVHRRSYLAMGSEYVKS
jgi:ketosteroid isomerase-like protein